MKAEPDATAFSLMVRQKAGIAPMANADPGRVERAENVKATYNITECAEDTWYVQHPTEDDRAYLVDLTTGTCQCPDFQCRNDQYRFVCKHLIALRDLTGRELPQDIRRAKDRENDPDRKFSNFMAQMSDDPYGVD